MTPHREDDELDMFVGVIMARAAQDSSIIHKRPPPQEEEAIATPSFIAGLPTPDHWPTSENGRSIFEIIGRNTTDKQETIASTASPFFYSINRLLTQQDQECWENNIDSSSCCCGDSCEEDRTIPVSDLVSNLHIQPITSILRSNPNHSYCSYRRNKTKKKMNVDFSIEPDTIVYTRPLTSNDNKSSLYYTNDEVKDFKQEYRDERKMIRLRERKIWLNKLEKSTRSATVEYEEEDASSTDTASTADSSSSSSSTNDDSSMYADECTDNGVAMWM
jgi:hypothetical protein